MAVGADGSARAVPARFSSRRPRRDDASIVLRAGPVAVESVCGRRFGAGTQRPPAPSCARSTSRESECGKMPSRAAAECVAASARSGSRDGGGRPIATRRPFALGPRLSSGQVHEGASKAGPASRPRAGARRSGAPGIPAGARRPSPGRGPLVRLLPTNGYISFSHASAECRPHGFSATSN
jgi:hypothetical protein